MRNDRQPDSPLPRNVAKRIANRIAENNQPVVVTSRNGKPSRVFGYDEYTKMVELPHRVKPWEHRKQTKATPDPFGAVDAEPPVRLTRKDLYDKD